MHIIHRQVGHGPLVPTPLLSGPGLAAAAGC